MRHLLGAAVVLVLATGCGQSPSKPPETQEHKAMRQAALSRAEYICDQHLGSGVPADQRQRCIKAEAAAIVRQWDKANPGQ